MIRVLLADDHPVVRAGIATILEAADDVTIVGQAEDGPTAVEMALRLSPDVVLMDLRMPGFDGDEATAQILAREPSIRVVILTTYQTDASILTAIERGATGYLLKAAPHEEILAGVRAVARGEVALSPSIAAALVRRSGKPVSLSPREIEVLALVARGASNLSIAQALFVGEATVKTHLQHVFEKLEVSDRTRAVTKAMELGLLRDVH